MPPKIKKEPAANAERTKSNGVPSTTGIAAGVSTLEAGGVAASTPEVTGQTSGTNASEERVSATVEAGDTAGLAAGASIFDPRGDVITRMTNFAETVDVEQHHRVVEFFANSERAENDPPSAIRVNCSAEGFRRGGQRHPLGPADYPLDHFTGEQLEQILGDAMFTVELV